MALQLLSGREIVRGLEEKATDNIVDVYKTMGDDFVVYDTLVANILPGHNRIARRVVDELIGDTFQLSHDGSMIRNTIRP